MNLSPGELFSLMLAFYGGGLAVNYGFVQAINWVRNVERW